MKKLLLLSTVLLLLAGTVASQETYFGKNKVIYKDFDWNYIQTRHFDIYFYENAYPTAKFAAEALETAYVEISKEIDYHLQSRIPVFIYNSNNDFQQTNIISSLLPEGVGGFTESLKKRVALPFDGSYQEFNHTLHHELTHAMIYDMLFGRSLASVLSRQRLFELPDWFSEGYADWSASHGWDAFSDMYVRDATINGYLIPPPYLSGYQAYRQGQAMIQYIVDKYGEDKIADILKNGRIQLTMNKTLKTVLGVDEEKFYEGFCKEMKRRYWPSLAQRKEADETAKQLTKSREDGSYFNEKPEFTPDGDKIAIFTDKSDYTEIQFIDALTGKRLSSLTKAERSGDLESLHFFVSGLSFSPDGKNLVFVAKSKGKESLFFVDVRKKEIYRRERFNYYHIVNPSWSPDGTRIAFSALDTYKRDLFVFDVAGGKVTQITDDRFDDNQPSWLPGSDGLVFSSDRPHPRNAVPDSEGHPSADGQAAPKPGGFDYGLYNLFKIDLATGRVEPLDVGAGQNTLPRVSPDGKKLAFLSTRNGIANLYVSQLDGTGCNAVTDILTDVHSFSWSPKGDKLAFSAFFKGGYDVFVLSELRPQGTSGVLELTDYAAGKYDHPGPKSPADSTADTTASSAAATSAVTDTSAARTDTLLASTSDSAVTRPGTAGDSAATAITASDSAAADSGVYDDEYVYVSSARDSALNAVLIPIPDDSMFAAKMKPEPASFDSIPPLLPSGEYEIKKYKVKFTPDFVGGGFAYDNFFGVQGQTYFLFSDYLGNHEIYVATDLVNTIDQSYIQGYYFNNTHRMSYGAGLFHSKNYYLDNNDSLFSDRYYGIQLFARRPFSTFSRLEAQLSQFFIDRKYEDREFEDPNRKRNSKVTTLALAHITDNVLWGYTAPINGTRSKISIDGGVNLFDSGDISFYSVGLDYRKYWHVAQAVSMAFRVSGGASFGDTPKRYFLGGTTNWIGQRTLDATVYDIENLYFSDVVTPLRGYKYYELQGDRYALINWEFRFPSIQVLALRYPLPIVLTNVTGALFYDMGATWFGDDFKLGTSRDGHSRLADVKTGFGVGIRLNLFGFALLRYDLAWATDYYKIHKPVGYFSFGADF